MSHSQMETTEGLWGDEGRALSHKADGRVRHSQETRISGGELMAVGKDPRSATKDEVEETVPFDTIFPGPATCLGYQCFPSGYLATDPSIIFQYVTSLLQVPSFPKDAGAGFWAFSDAWRAIQLSATTRHAANQVALPCVAWEEDRRREAAWRILVFLFFHPFAFLASPAFLVVLLLKNS
ncbi:uncharacterized protein LY79DRAFT_540049 [Colletotrichum navitas]|uniref:Uncharacterized protein n=1 Tax=Colletotrichum navitas TaxID=681940 RepID=A0AAD8QBT5_9PEZI|nr:uncharacterized protein LY79DRAFT_540049 [Colletotrichum navitas]KAK1598049.1 hypothetical protein LY79DRAFT_540049 [Colletotrichum navitas]